MIACAAKTSSACPLRAPVERHWVMNFGLAREAIRFISQIDVGTVTMATIASSGETANIITVTPTTISSDVRIWLELCWRLWARLSMSLVTRLRRSPRVCPST